MDIYDKNKRSKIMKDVKSCNTQPELYIRKLLHKMGFRFRVNKKSLPGKPDIVLPKYKTIVFVHGCFWHQHENCNKARKPKSNKQFWIKKIKKNIERDERNIKELEDLGWKVIIVWECEIRCKNIHERLYNKITGCTEDG